MTDIFILLVFNTTGPLPVFVPVLFVLMYSRYIFDNILHF